MSALCLLSLLCFLGCNKESNFKLVVNSTEEVISSGEYVLDFPYLVDNGGNIVISYKISVLSIIRDDGTQIQPDGKFVDFSVQGRYTVTYGVDGLSEVKPVKKVYTVVDETPPVITAFNYPESVVVGRKYEIPEIALYDDAGVNEQKTKIDIIDKYNNVVETSGRNFTVVKAGDYRFRIKVEDLNGVSRTYYYPFVSYEVSQPIDKKVGYFDEEFGQKQLVTGLQKGVPSESYSISYTTERAFGDEKGSTVITVNEQTTDVCLRLVSPYIQNISDYSRLVYRIYIETVDKPYTTALAGVYTNYKNVDINKWQEMFVSVKALKEGGVFINGLNGECIIADDITNLTLRLFRWSNPAFGGIEDKEGFPKGTKIYISAMVLTDADPSIIYEFNTDEGDHGAKAVNKDTGKPVNSYGGSVENGSFVGLGEGCDNVRFYLQNEDQSEDEYLVYLPLLNVKEYGSVIVTINTNNCKKMGISAEQSILFANPSNLTITMVYNEESDDMTVTFASGSQKMSVTVTDSDIINGESQFVIYAVGGSYTEIYIAPIRKG